MNELEFVEWIRQSTAPAADVAIGPGDDAAVVRIRSDRLIVTTDLLADGCEFILREAGAYRVGRKAMAVNLSDIAAMAATPRWATVSVAVPSDFSRDSARELFRGLNECAARFATAIVGGDTNSWHGALVVSVCLIGTADSRPPVTRRGARPGDWLLVTGSLGGSILGKHLDFTPRVAEAQQLADRADLHAMIDISDGLALDAWRLCRESCCGAILVADEIPIAEAAYQMHDDKTPLEHALSDGEDFELLFAVSAADGERLLREQPIEDVSLTRIGTIIEQTGLWLEQEGRRAPLAPKGYVHEFG